MYDIVSAEKFLENKKNKKLKLLLENKKEELISKSNEFKDYPLYIFFLQNLYKNNSYFPKVEIKFYTNDYRGVISSTNISKYETIISIPKECLITLELVLSKPYGKQISELMHHELNSPKHCLLSCFLLFEENNPLYKYYFDLLPKDYGNFPIFYNHDELEYLCGSPFLNLVINKKIDMQMDYNKLCEKVKNFAQFSFDKFCKARCIISSRVFGITMHDVKTDALVPFADLLNHRRPRQTQWFYDDDKDAFIVQAIENIEQGSEIFDSYGKKTNARFLLNYGFSIEKNETSEYSLTISSLETGGVGNWPLIEIKKKLFKNEDFYKTFNLNINFQESQILELINFLRFMTYDGDSNYLQKAILSAKNTLNPDMSINYYFFYPINKINEINVLKYLKYLCEQALSKYPTSLTKDNQIYEEKKESPDFNFNYRNCLLLLMSEKKVLIFYIEFCDYCLKLLRMKNKKKVIEKATRDLQENNLKFNFYIKDAILKIVKEEEENNVDIENKEEEIKDSDQSHSMEEEEDL
jgi:histone-lysine N-methyltransferase SETD3